MTEWQQMTDDERTATDAYRAAVSNPSVRKQIFADMDSPGTPLHAYCQAMDAIRARQFTLFQPHIGRYIVLQRRNGDSVLLLLMNLAGYSPVEGLHLIGYEDGELTIDGPITVPLSDVVEWVGEDD